MEQIKKWCFYNDFITVYDNEASTKKKIYLKRSNIEVESGINENTLISKIEYREVKEKQIRLFNIKEKLGNIQKKIQWRIKNQNLSNKYWI